MKKIDLKGLISNKAVLIGLVASIVILGTSFALNTYSKEKAKETVTYDYDEVEQQLAEEVKEYLAQYLELSEQTSSDIADVAVQNYNIVVSSNVDTINDEITDAVKGRIISTMEALINQPEVLTAENLYALSSGVTEIIWNKILDQLNQSDHAKLEEYRDEYLYLSQSLQEQINSLKENKAKISINANIIDKTQQEITSEKLLAGIENMSDEERKLLANELGISADEIAEYMKTMETTLISSNADISKDFSKELNDLKKELEKQISSTSGKIGATGATGAKGDKGDKGSDGNSIFIRYSASANGANMTSTPTENTKYIGTYEGTIASTDPAKYRWAKYVGENGKDGTDGKSVFIRYAETSTGTNMTATPTASTKYFGTYSGVQPSDNPADYTWTQYKDTISYYTEEDNTLHFVIP